MRLLERIDSKPREVRRPEPPRERRPGGSINDAPVRSLLSAVAALDEDEATRRRERGSLKAARGKTLSGQELRMLKHLSDGLTYGEIAFRVGLSVSTVRTHLHNVYAKLGVVDRAQAVLAAERSGLIEKPTDGATLVGADAGLVDRVLAMREDELLAQSQRPGPYLPDPDPDLLALEERGESFYPHEGVLADMLIASHLKGAVGEQAEWDEAVRDVAEAESLKDRRDMLVKASSVALSYAARIDARRKIIGTL